MKNLYLSGQEKLAKIFLLCGTKSSCKPCSQSALHCGLLQQPQQKVRIVYWFFILWQLNYSWGSALHGPKSWCRPSLPYCCNHPVLPWTTLTWQNCTSTAAPVANASPDKRGVSDRNDLNSRSCQLSKHGICAGWDICTLNINIPSDSISFFHLNKCRYLLLWLSNHMAEAVLSVFSPPCLILQPPLNCAPISAVSLPGCSASWGHGCFHIILCGHLYLAQGAVKLILH